LKCANQPLAVLLLQDVRLKSLLWPWQSRWSSGAGQSPTNMRDRNIGREKPNVDICDRESAFFENVSVSVGEFFLDLGASFPPPADEVYAVAVLDKQARVGFGIMLIPGFRLPCFQRTNRGFVLRLICRKRCEGMQRRKRGMICRSVGSFHAYRKRQDACQRPTQF